MKKSVLIITLLFFTVGIYAQEKFKVPGVTVEQKYNNMLIQAESMMIVGISYAKTHGATAADYGNFIGNQVKNEWDKKKGFDGFVNAILYNFSCFSPDPGIEITANTTNKIVFETHLIGNYFQKEESVFGVTYNDLMDFLISAQSTLAEHMGCMYELKYDKESIYVTISKK